MPLSNKNKNGFTLAEMLAVIIIMAILAALSTPLVREYIRDSANDKAKTQLQLIAHAVRNFKADNPGVTLTKGVINAATPIPHACTVNQTSVAIGMLFACSYLRHTNWAAFKYTFEAGSTAVNTCGGKCSNPVAAMVGTDTAGKYKTGYCACVDEWGDVHDNL